MKKLLLFSAIFLLIPTSVYATDVNVDISNNSSGSNSSVTVDSHTNGTSTTCVNGNCTTSGGDSHSKVCVNGKCTESDGDLDVNDDNGKTQVHINKSDDSDDDSKVSITSTPKQTVTPGNDKEASREAAEIVKKIQETRKTILDDIKEFIKNLFGFGN